MLFPSEIFLFLFLPLVLVLYFGPLRNKPQGKNWLLLAASLLFYAYGEPVFVLLMLVMIGIHYGAGWLVWKIRTRRLNLSPRLVIFLTVVLDLLILGYFKYADFLIGNLNNALGWNLELTGNRIPVGISFFTFQAISFVVDMARDPKPKKPLIQDTALYISFFPQLIAGPIVRYNTVAEEIRKRHENLDDFARGVNRFIIGLGKKVLLANQFAVVADAAFATNAVNSVLMFWLGAFSYTLQIFYDFAGYSDMAIGLGWMFGFHFEENFNYPYLSRSVSEFWRRWHMSLQTWFRDYVYIPLGGSRVKTRSQLVFNLFVVWLLTGIWHGANWTFICWGLMYFLLLLLERFTNIQQRLGKFSWLYTFLFVMLGWVLFRSDSITQPIHSVGGMVGIGAKGFMGEAFVQYLRQYGIWYVAGIVCCCPVFPVIERAFRKKPAYQLVAGLATLAIFAVSVLYIFSNAYNPFIYFNF
ncbi:MBOAT family O-acyltransferase [uncultured Dubosiella sp.]|uniref:MBOAT family O-acyltransferase n=1 Tax=uncultured Dubosiella sp. TaxID=1937011 RepID=UPI00259B5D54|nr:MBOAT family O-acyltransferase [uncultured Dubosiella sp.]